MIQNDTMTFTCTHESAERLFANAVAGLRANCRPVHGFAEPVLNEGGVYAGVWLECAPHEGLVYAALDSAVAKANHRVFFQHQRPDGQFPCYVLGDRAGFTQIQMVTPIARTAWELARLTGDEPFLAEAYAAGAAWDAWLARHRDRQGLGLVEAFCEFDTGHDNSPRWHGFTKKCHDDDARRCPPLPGLPRLAPDLSATLYGGRLALAAMAAALGRPGDADRWREAADHTRQAILRFCYDDEDACFYDVAADGTRLRLRGDALFRVLAEGVPDAPLFERIYQRQVRNPHAFWTPYPLPSIAADDPAFIQAPPLNCWGGPSQALTALRTPRWFEAYGKHLDHAHLMRRWLEALGRADGFMQQMDPWTGAFNTSPGYSPAMCVALDFTARLHGVIQDVPDELGWGIGLPDGATECAFTRHLLGGGAAELIQDPAGAVARLDGRELFRVTGGPARVVTDRAGGVQRLIALNLAGAPLDLRINAGFCPQA